MCVTIITFARTGKMSCSATHVVCARSAVTRNGFTENHSAKKTDWITCTTNLAAFVHLQVMEWRRRE